MLSCIAFVEVVPTGVLHTAAGIAMHCAGGHVLETAPKNLAQCKLAIIHCSSTGWEHCVRLATPGMILIKVSTVDQLGATVPLRDSRGVVLLQLVPSLGDVSPEEWRAVFDFFLGAPDPLNWHPGDHPWFSRLFVRRDSPLLAALMVLCYGFLHAPPEKREVVAAASWWAPLWRPASFNEEGDAMLYSALGASPVDPAPLPAVKALLDQIRNGGPIGDAIVRPAESALREWIATVQKPSP